MDNEKAYAVEAAKPSLMEELFRTLSRQQELIFRLEDRVRPISAPQPRNDSVGSLTSPEGVMPHLSIAIDLARSNSEQISYLLDTIVL